MIQVKVRPAFVLLALAIGSAAAASDLASDSSVDGFSPPQGVAGNGGETNHGRRVAVGVKVSALLGAGIEGAVEVTRKSNIRGGFNFFNYGLTETKDGIGYNAELHLRSADALYDWFPFRGGFHLSGGALLYNGNQIKATASVPAGGGFTLGGVAYTSEASNPISGTAELALGNKGAPMGLLGWGNLIPRSGRHLGVNFEIGAAFIGAPQSTLALTGGACVSSTVCLNAASDPTIQANITSEKKKVDNAVSFVKALPVISLGIGYSF